MINYTYDSWGKLLSIGGSLATTLGTDNPFRYRGYYYDTETGLYYVSSRYYDPEIGRWINADGIIDGRMPIANNLFNYCCNNPINNIDVTGKLFGSIFALSLLIVGVVVTLSSCSPKANLNEASSSVASNISKCK